MEGNRSTGNRETVTGLCWCPDAVRRESRLGDIDDMDAEPELELENEKSANESPVWLNSPWDFWDSWGSWLLENKQKRQTLSDVWILLELLDRVGDLAWPWRRHARSGTFFGALFQGCSVSVSRVSRISRISRVSRISVSLHREIVLSPSSTNFIRKSLVYFGFQKLNTLPSALPPANYNRTALLVHLK